MNGGWTTRLMIGASLRLYAVLYFANRLRHWLWNKSPKLIRRMIGIGEPYPKSRRAQESFILVEAQGAVYPFTMSAAAVLILGFGRVLGFTAQDAMALGGWTLFVFFAAVIALSFVLDRRLLGSDEEQKILLRRMKALPQLRLLRLAVQAYLGLADMAAAIVLLLVP